MNPQEQPKRPPLPDPPQVKLMLDDEVQIDWDNLPRQVSMHPDVDGLLEDWPMTPGGTVPSWFPKKEDGQPLDPWQRAALFQQELNQTCPTTSLESAASASEKKSRVLQSLLS